MTTIDPTRCKDVPIGAEVLGVDGDGRNHHYTSPVGGTTVYVERPDGWYNRWDLGDTPCDGLEDWIDHVARRRGAWKRLFYNRDGRDAVARLADRLTEVQG